MGGGRGRLVASPGDEGVGGDFHMQIRTWGQWGRVGGICTSKGLMDEKDYLKGLVENLNDVISLCFSVPFQMCLLLGAMSFMWQEWTKFSFFFTVALVSGAGLYFFWFKNLKSEEQCLEEDKYYEEKAKPSTST